MLPLMSILQNTKELKETFMDLHNQDKGSNLSPCLSLFPLCYFPLAQRSFLSSFFLAALAFRDTGIWMELHVTSWAPMMKKHRRQLTKPLMEERDQTADVVEFVEILTEADFVFAVLFLFYCSFIAVLRKINCRHSIHLLLLLRSHIWVSLVSFLLFFDWTMRLIFFSFWTYY